MKKSEAITLLNNIQKEFYSILYEICKSEQIGGGVKNLSLLYKDLCGVKTQIDDLIKKIAVEE